MSSANNKIIARRFFEEGFNEGDTAVFDALVAKNAKLHDPSSEESRGTEGVSFWMERYKGAFPDAKITVEDIIAEWDRVVIRWKARGTHRGELSGIAPTGKKVNFSGITVFRILVGRIQELWTESDMMNILQQVGGIPVFEAREKVIDTVP